MKSKIFFCLCLFLSACSSTSISDFEGKEPRFDIFQYFKGDVVGYGVVLDRSEKPIKQFRVNLHGTEVDNKMTLDEQFSYLDGSVDSRVWTITKNTDGTYTGEASDVVGVATGVTAGNALNWSYTLRIPYDGSTIDVQFNDWMYLQQDGVLMNKAVMRKFGFYVGEVLISFKKP